MTKLANKIRINPCFETKEFVTERVFCLRNKDTVLASSGVRSKSQRYK